MPPFMKSDQYTIIKQIQVENALGIQICCFIFPVYLLALDNEMIDKQCQPRVIFCGNSSGYKVCMFSFCYLTRMVML